MGGATVEWLHRDGWTVTGLDTDVDAVERMAERLPGTRWVAGDVVDEHALHNAVRQGVADQGRLDLVANVAGVYRPGSLDTVSHNVMHRLLSVHVTGAALLAQATRPYLGGGVLVQVSSSLAALASVRGGAYAASKRAAEQWADCVALELAGDGIRVISLAPGPTDTGILQKGGLSGAQVQAIHADEAVALPLGRIGTIEEIAAWICRLAVHGDWMTGTRIATDGGHTLL